MPDELQTENMVDTKSGPIKASPKFEENKVMQTRMDKLAEELLRCGDLEEAYLRCGYYAADRGRRQTRLKEIRASYQFKLALERACEKMYLKALHDVRNGSAQASAVQAAKLTYRYFTGRDPRFGVISSKSVKSKEEKDQKW